jgi:hypothetical protein
MKTPWGLLETMHLYHSHLPNSDSWSSNISPGTLTVF